MRKLAIISLLCVIWCNQAFSADTEFCFAVASVARNAYILGYRGVDCDKLKHATTDSLKKRLAGNKKATVFINVMSDVVKNACEFGAASRLLGVFDPGKAEAIALNVCLGD